MPVDLHIDFDTNNYSDIMKKLSMLASEKEINAAINRGAKKAANVAKAETVRQIANEFLFPASELKGTIKTRSLGSSEIGAVMQISSGVFPLYKSEGVTPKEVMPPAKGPVQAQVKKNGGATLNRAFVAKMPNGHTGVYEREDSKRKSKDSHGGTPNRIKRKGKMVDNTEKWHINELFAPSVPGMFGRNEETPVNQAVIEKAGETVNKAVFNELERMVNG